MFQFRQFRQTNEKNVLYNCPACGDQSVPNVSSHVRLVSHQELNAERLAERLKDFMMGSFSAGGRGPVHLPSLLQELVDCTSDEERASVLQRWFAFLGVRTPRPLRPRLWARGVQVSLLNGSMSFGVS